MSNFEWNYGVNDEREEGTAYQYIISFENLEDSDLHTNSISNLLDEIRTLVGLNNIDCYSDTYYSITCKTIELTEIITDICNKYDEIFEEESDIKEDDDKEV